MKSFSKLAINASALALFALSGPAFAQTRETPPAPGAARPFTLPAVTSYELPNGTKVTLVPYGKTPQVTVLAAVWTGNIDDGENTGLADLTGDMMEKGAAGRDASQIAEMVAAMGGNLSLGVGLDTVSVSTGVLSEYADEAIGLVADVLIRPDFPAGELDKVRADMLRNLSVAKSTPGGMAAEAFGAALYGDHPYGHVFSTPEKLNSYTLDQVKAFHAANFGAKRTHLYVVGRFDDGDVRAAIQRSFGGWKAGPEVTDLPPPAAGAAQVRLVDRPGAPQSTLRIGQRVDTPPFNIDLMAANTLLGGYFSSRITRNIREDKGYTYSPGSSLSQRAEAIQWAQNADVTAEATGPSITEILKEIRRMQSEPPSEAEVRGIKNYMNGIFVIGLASRGGVAGQLATLDRLGSGPDYLNTYVSEVSGLTAKDFQEATARYLPVDGMTYVVVGPLASVRAQLAQVPELADRLPE